MNWQLNFQDVIRQHGFDEYLLWPGSLDRDAVTDAEYAHFMEWVLANDFKFTTEMIRRIESRYGDVVTLDHQRRREVHRGRFGPDVFQEAACRFIRRHQERLVSDGRFKLYADGRMFGVANKPVRRRSPDPPFGAGLLSLLGPLDGGPIDLLGKQS